jgi:hypothetical protein
MPAMFLMMRFGRMPFSVPLPWFLLWVLLLPFALLAQLAGWMTLALGIKVHAARVLQVSMAAWSILPGLHGLGISVRSKSENLQFRFV